jgi:hypothetical protein
VSEATRFIEEERLLTVVEQATEAVMKGLPDQDLSGVGIGADVMEQVRAYLAGQPEVPELVSRQQAADIMGVQSPHVSRYVTAGRLPAPIEVEGTAPVYLRSAAEALGAELADERAERERKRAEAV